MKQAQSSSEEKQSSRKHSRFWIFILLGPCFFFGVIYIIWLFLQQPAIGEVRVAQKTPTEENDIVKKQKQYQGKYLTFSYPGIYEEKSHEIPITGPVKESIFLSATDVEGSKIAVTVEERTEDDFEASPSFQMRLNKPIEYKKEFFSENGFNGFLFAKNNQVFEQTAFFFDKGLLISVSFSSPFTLEGLKKKMMDFLQDFHIKE